MAEEEMFDIYQAAEQLDLTPEYIRLMVRNKVIRSVQKPVKEGSFVKKHWIPKSELMAFASRDNARAPKRTDGRKKRCLYAMDDEVLRIKELLYQTHDPGLMIVAETLQLKGDNHEDWVPPSKRRPIGE